MPAAKGMIKAKHTAAMGVSIGSILKYQGTMIPMQPNISETPINFMNGGGSPSTPVCPMATNFFSGKKTLQMPE